MVKVMLNFLLRVKNLKYLDFDVKNGLGELRKLINEIEGKNIGIRLLGNVGITSHFGDVLRQFNIPSYIENILDK